MAFTKKTWGTYKWDDSKTVDENIAAAKAAKGDTGARGPEGPAGKDGAAGIGIKSIALTVDADGKVTGGTMTKTDNSTVAITVTTAE